MPDILDELSDDQVRAIVESWVAYGRPKRTAEEQAEYFALERDVHAAVHRPSGLSAKAEKSLIIRGLKAMGRLHQFDLTTRPNFDIEASTNVTEEITPGN